MEIWIPQTALYTDMNSLHLLLIFYNVQQSPYILIGGLDLRTSSFSYLILSHLIHCSVLYGTVLILALALPYYCNINIIYIYIFF